MSGLSTSDPTGSTTYTIYRDVAHPWSGEPGWDVMLIQSATDGFALACEKRGWQAWCVGESLRGSPRGVLLKPHRLTFGSDASHWNDPTPWPEIPI